MNRTRSSWKVVETALCLAFLVSVPKVDAQISPGAPTKEYIRLADRVIAIERIAQSGGLPNGLVSTPINSTCSLNGAAHVNGAVTVAGTGANGLGASDSFEFVSVPVTGDVTILGRIPAGLVGTLSSNVAVGLMLRTDLSASPPFALVGIGRSDTASNPMLVFKKRTTPGTSPTNTYASAFHLFGQYWFKLVRSGSTISGYTSGNGVDWTPLGAPLTGITAPTIYAGLAVSNNTSNCATGTILTATFDNVLITTTPDFFLTTSPASVSSSAAGETNTYTLGVNPLYGFANSVSFYVAGLPSGVSWGFTPSMVVPPGSTILTVTVPPDTPAGSYPFTIHSSGGGKAHTNYATLAVATPSTSSLPAGWRTTAFSSTCLFNAASYANGIFAVTGTGGQLANAPDGIEFVYAPVSGDVTMVARIPISPVNLLSSVQAGGAGLLLKNDLSSGSDYVFVGVSTQNPAAQLYNAVLRKRTGGPTQTHTSTWGDLFQNAGLFYGPFWFKLVRSGTAISGYKSLNGVDWTQIGTSVTGFTNATMYVGLAVTSGSANCTSAAAMTGGFDNVALLGGTGGVTPDFWIGLPSGVPSVPAGSSLEMTTTVAATGGFVGEVAFGISGLPNGSGAVFSPPSVGGQGPSALVIGTSSSLTMPGSYTPTVTGDSGSLSHSATATFVVDPPLTQPPTVSVSPASGSGLSQTFSLTATEPSGAANIRWLQFVMNETPSGIRACYVHYDVASNEVYLRDDTDPGWAGSKQLGAAGSLTNSQCTLDTGASSFSAPGGITVTLHLALTFKAAFAGGKTIHALVDSGNWNSGWYEAGVWTVPLPPGALPSGVTAVSINGVCPSVNSASYNIGTYTLSGTGGFLSNPDGFEFAYAQVTGDATFVARIPAALAGAPLTATLGGVGIMLRLGPTSNAPYAMVGIGNSSGNKLMFRTRSTTTGAATSTYGSGFAAPYWFKLVRSGSTITGYTSSNGTTWTQLGSPWTIPGTPAPTTLSAGIAVTSGRTGCLPTDATTATFDNVTITNP
ncbi:MAG: hypothetical protein ACRD88_19450 [Terriglobia bacterium]